MNTFLTLVILLFKSWIRSRVAVFFGILFPIMLFLVFGSIFGSPSPPNYSLYVRNLDLDPSGQPNTLSKTFIEVLNTTVFDVKLIGLDETPRSTGFAAVRVLTIPKGFTEGLLNKTIANRVMIMIDTTGQFIKMAGENIPPEQRENLERGLTELERFSQTLNASSIPLTLEGSADDRLLQPIEGIIRNIAAEFELALLNASDALTIKVQITSVRQLKPVDYYLPGYIAAFIMSNGLIGVSSLISDYKRRGVIKLLATTNVRKRTWIVSVLVVQTLAAALLTAVMLTVGWIVFGIQALPDILSAALIVMGVAAFTGLGILIGGSIRDADAVTAAGNLLTFPQMFLSGAFWPIELMPPIMQQIAQYTPLYHFHNALRHTLITGSLEQATTSVVIVVAVTALAVMLAVALTKWKDF